MLDATAPARESRPGKGKNRGQEELLQKIGKSLL
jgi:hypothetical protein